MRYKMDTIHYHLMIIPGLILLFFFQVFPMFGTVIAFQDFIPALGIFKSEWVGLDNFRYMLMLDDSKQIFFNTIYIATMKIIFSILVPLVFALLLNEMVFKKIKSWIQTIVYLPHFLSWVILAGILMDMLSGNGIINQALSVVRKDPILFLGSNFWFPIVVIISDVWKELGFNTIIFLAALIAINPALLEAAEIDGANRFKRLIHITLPGIVPTIILLATLSLGQILNAGFEQIFNLYNPLVYQSGDIIDTYVYRVGLLQSQYGLATAVGLLKSIISFVLIIFAYRLAYKHANYRIF